MHVGFIMDGNRRWAKKSNFLPYFGHNAGGETLEKILESCFKLGIKRVTIYALSTENLINRSKVEIKALFEILKRMIFDKKDKLKKQDTRVNILGDVDSLPVDVIESLKDIEQTTSQCKSLILEVCINYGGRQEIVNAVKKMVQKGQEICEENIFKNLYSQKEPDLIIRTGGQQRLSNFLLWQSAYSELYFTEKLWPDFKEVDLKLALDFFHSQKRNFGK